MSKNTNLNSLDVPTEEKLSEHSLNVEFKNDLTQIEESLLDSKCLIHDYMPTEIPPQTPFEYILDEFTEHHAVAYIFLNLFQQANQDGFRETMEVVEELSQCFDFKTKQEITKTCAEVIHWSQKLKPRELKPSIHDLLWLAKLSLSGKEVARLMGRVHDLARIHEDVYGNVMRYTRHLDCFFMELVSEPQVNLALPDLAWV